MTRTIVAITLLAALAAPRAVAQQPDSLPRVRLPRLPGDTLRFRLPLAMTGEGLLASPRPAPAALARSWADSLRADAALKDAARLRVALAGGDTVALFGIKAAAPGQLAELPEAPGPSATVQPSILRRYADLGMLLNARFELRFDQLRNLRCQPSDFGLLSSGCNSAVAPPQLNPQIQVRTGGIIGQRVHLDVDYDSQREFDASNNIKVFYQGLEDEVIRRIEVGNVSFNAPSSRFITAGIPANNFGFTASGQLGPVDFSGIFAQQKGNVVQGKTFLVGAQTVQPVDRQVNDRDFEPDRFFFVVDPATVPGYPTVDILNLNQAGLPLKSQVVQVRVYRRLSTVSLTTAQQSIGGIPAVANRPDSPQRAGPFSWQLLIEGRDYYLDPSGLWFALTNQLNAGDYLAVSYITAAGDTVGTFPAAAQPNRTDTLRLIRQPQQTPDLPTFRYAMRNVYRIGGISGTVREGMQVQVLVAQSARPSSGAPTFLSLLGMALPTDQTRFDQVNRLFPRARDPANGSPLTDYYIVFPSLVPFADSSLLPAQYRNDSLYRTPTYLLFTEGPTPVFQVALHYQAQGGDERGTLSLGAAQIRPGTERLSVGNVSLVRNVDYTINYDVGQITFLHPDSLFAQPQTVNVQYEEQPAFASAPTSIYGLQTRYDLGIHGSIAMLGLLQQQSSNFTRPPLGFEPSSNFVGGISGSFRFEPMGLTRLLNRLPLVRTTAPSAITLDAELATSRPSPNQTGTAWVETFEGGSGTFLPLNENAWNLGSRPASPHGLDAATGIDPTAGFQDVDAASLVWQNQISGSGGGFPQYTPQQIDPSIVQQGTGQSYETVLWLFMHPDSVGGLPPNPATYQNRWVLPHTGGPRWRSMTLPLSTTGQDLSRVEYLEFWVFEPPNAPDRAAGTTVAFDFGRPFEDAVSFVPTSFTVTPQGDTVYSGRRRIGEGRLQTERDTLTNAWNALTDDNGIWGAVADSIFNQTTTTVVRDMPLCTSQLASGPQVYPWGDQQARCTRHDGNPETEDLDGDGHLDTLVTALSESYFRYVFHLGDEKYHVRDGGPVLNGKVDTTGGRWRLYRIPFRTDTFQVGSPDIRQVRALRMTVVVPPGSGSPPVYFALARVELVGAPWVKRSTSPIAGLSGHLGSGLGEVIASTVSTENFSDLGYTSPPGVTDQGSTVSGGFNPGPTQINETSLRLVGTQVAAGQRAEAYFQFPEGQRNFLGYRTLRVWARGRGAGWDNDQLSFYVKVGQDENNFYMYKTHVHAGTWLPDIVVSFAEWQALRSDIERRYLGGERPSGAARCGGDSLAYVACDSGGSYVVHVRDPAVAPPNLAQVRELAVGFIRDSGAVADSSELWVDDIRLSQVVKDAGYAGAVNMHVTAADVADVNVMVSRRDAQFRQLGQSPSYVTDNELQINSTVRLEQFGLNRLGLTAPLTFQINQSNSDPYYLTGTDVLASPLTGLRRPQSTQSNVNFALRRSRRGTRWWQKWVVDNLGLTASLASANATTELSQTSSSLGTLAASYAGVPGERSFRYLPDALVRLLRSIPLLGRAQFVQGLEASRLRWSPVSVTFSSGITSVHSNLQTFGVPIATTSDTLASSARAQQASLGSQAGLELRPLASLALGALLSSTRDLKDYGDSTTIGVLAHQASGRFAGVGVGFESARTLGTHLSFNPGLFSWLRPRLNLSTNFSLTRDPNGGAPERSVNDSAGAYRLPTAFANGKTWDLGGSLDFGRAMRGLLGDSSRMVPWFEKLLPVDFATHEELRSQFYRAGFDPSLGYQLAFGGVDAFRGSRGRAAVSASDTRQARLASGLRLPLGLSVTAAYSHGTQQLWSARGEAQSETEQTNTTWPDVQGRWSWAPRSAFVQHILSNLSASAGVRTVTSSSAQPPLQIGTGPADTAGGVFASQRTRSVPLSLSVVWAPRITTNFGYTSSSSSAVQTGNVTQNDTRELSGGLSFTFRMPQQFIPLKSDVRTAMRYSSSTTTGCLFLAGAAGCLPIVNSGRQQYNFSMDTDLPPNVSAGLAVGYTLTTDAVLDRKFAQFTFTVSVNVNFQAGQPR